MASKDLIKVISKPAVPLKEMSLPDDRELSKDNLLFVTGKGGNSAIDKAGADKPLVMINSVYVTDIDYMVLDETGKIPTIKIIFNDNTGTLNSANYPKNDPIISVYIKPQNSKFKPIRCDFLIVEMKPLGSDNYSFSIYGELYIPKLYDNVSKSYSNVSSKDALLQLASDLNLGYAQNEISTSDIMTWINSNNNSLDFMKHVSDHAYKDDDTFFTSFIDKYYNINLIDVTEQLNINAEINNTYQNTTSGMQRNVNNERSEKSEGNTEFETDEVPIYLTNHPSDKGRPQFIKKFNLSGEVGSILQNRGYRHQIYYYDHKLESDKFTKFYVNPILIKGYKNNDLSLIPDDEVLRNNLIKKWQNIDYGNAHSEWNASKTINDHNNTELNKVKMTVETSGINFQIIKGSGLFVAMHDDIGEAKLQQANRDKTDGAVEETPVTDSTIVLNDTLSGRYYVNGTKYIYDGKAEGFQYSTEFELCKMNWRAEKNIIDNA